MAFRDRTCSRIGTTDYIAPEMLMDKSYTRATDWWALGVTVFEMLVGETPFYACDDLETHHNILSQDVEFPTFLSDEAVLFIRKRPKRRLGSGERDALEVREQPFFRVSSPLEEMATIVLTSKNLLYQEMDWNGLLAREIRPPFVPTIQGCYDVSNFEDEFTMETPALTPPLDPTALSLGEQELFSGFNYTGDWAMSSMPSASLKVHTH
ncbi:hypothetical protein JZ751_027817 [Albula glossodonta]|uniref:Uncharacterized protein n=1 Tax=Albula glossodonta TaxID=121402 RepID=A0A8T2P9S5_9TELE|nr:hypothetical protein JZ751_027817 [Albula glossodonta]